MLFLLFPSDAPPYVHGVFHAMKRYQTDTGVHFNHLVAREKIDQKRLKAALDYLLEAGFVYSTVDMQTYHTVDMN